MIIAGGVIGGRAPLLAYNGLFSDLGQNLTSVDVNDVPFGDEHPSRRVFALIGVGIADASVVSGVTIGGVTAIEHVQDKSTVLPNQCASIWSAAVPTGTSGTIHWGMSSSGDMDGAGVYCLSSYFQKNAAAVATNSAVGSGSGSAAFDVDAMSKGFVLGLFKISNTASVTWSISGSGAGVSLLPEEDVSTLHQMGGLYGSGLNAASPLALRASFTNSFGGPFVPSVCVAASFR